MSQVGRLADALIRTGSIGAGECCLLWPENRESIELMAALPGLATLDLVLDEPTPWALESGYPSRLAQGEALMELEMRPFDLVLARHPDLYQRPARWDSAMWFAHKHLKPGGRLVLSTQVQGEAYGLHEIALRMGLSLGPGSPYTAVPVALDGADRYILVYSLT